MATTQNQTNREQPAQAPGADEQTLADTTKGEPQPIGDRGAVKADSAPPAAG
jgi:hypothetical protein